MVLPPGFACEGKWHVVYRLHQAIYGLNTLTSKGARKQQRKALSILLVKPKRLLLIE